MRTSADAHGNHGDAAYAARHETLRSGLRGWSGYYKWDRQRKPPWPRFIQRTDGVALLVAGLWEYWEGAEVEDGLLNIALLTGPNAAIPGPLTQDGSVFLDAALGLRWPRTGTLQHPLKHERRDGSRFLTRSRHGALH